MSAFLLFGNGLVNQLGELELTAVNGVEFTHECAVVDLFGNGDLYGAGALAVELLVLNYKGKAVRIKNLQALYELEVLTENCNSLSALDGLSGLPGEAGNNRLSKGEGHIGLHFIVCGAKDQFATFGGNARRGVDPDHFAAYTLEVGYDDVVGEDDLLHIRETVAVYGHRLPGDHFGGREHLNLKAGFSRLRAYVYRACREGTQKGDSQKCPEI